MLLEDPSAIVTKNNNNMDPQISMKVKVDRINKSRASYRPITVRFVAYLKDENFARINYFTVKKKNEEENTNKWLRKHINIHVTNDKFYVSSYYDFSLYHSMRNIFTKSTILQSNDHKNQHSHLIHCIIVQSVSVQVDL